MKNQPSRILSSSAGWDFTLTKVIVLKEKSDGVTLIPCYNSKPGISRAKKEDLMELCTKNLIPKQYKPFYENL